jgi:hypothetical protein
MDLGEAMDLHQSALQSLSFVHALWFGDWKGQKVHVVTSFDKVAEVYTDRTEEFVEAFSESARGAVITWKIPDQKVIDVEIISMEENHAAGVRRIR